jgi:hypothetical protein
MLCSGTSTHGVLHACFRVIGEEPVSFDHHSSPSLMVIYIACAVEIFGYGKKTDLIGTSIS